MRIKPYVSLTNTVPQNQKTKKENFDETSSISSSGTSAVASGSCCVAPILGDAGKAADGTRSMSGVQGGAAATLYAVTSYISVASAVSSFKTVLENRRQVKIIQEALEEISALVPNEELRLCIKFLETTLSDVCFVRNVPGIMSAVASLLIGTGMFTAFPVSIAGLGLGTVDGALHVAKTVQLKQRYQKQIENILLDLSLTTEEQNAVVKVLKNEKHLSTNRCWGAIFTVLGVGALIVASLSMNDLFDLDPMTMMIVMLAGIVCLLPAIYLSIRYSPYKDLGLRKKEKELFKSMNANKRELLSRLKNAHNKVNVSEKYSEKLSQRTFAKKIFDKIQLGFPQFLTYVTFNIPDSYLSKFSRSIKENMSESFYNIFSWGDRINALKALEPSEQTVEDSEAGFISLLGESYATLGQVLQILAMQELDKNNSLNSPYKKFFSTSNKKEEIISFLNELRNTPSCCVPFATADDLKLFEIQDPTLRHEFINKLVGRFDQYIVFSLPNIAEKDLRIYSRILGFSYSAKKHTEKTELLIKA